ncbi:MAG: alanine racemase [Alphaproteobacteria bacterium]
MPPSDHAGAALTIDLGAVARNYRTLSDQLGGVACAGVVKGNAYGLGVGEIAPVLAREGCEKFFVSSLDEAVELRGLLPDKFIAVLNGVLAGTEPVFTDHNLLPVLNDLGQIERWAAHSNARGGDPLEALVHLDTGMNRLGLPPEESLRLAAEPQRLDGLRLSLVISHLACAEQPDNPMNEAQRIKFDGLRALLPAAPASFANSSGVFLGADYHYDLGRPGVALYGVNPTPDKPNPMAEVVCLHSKIIQLRDVDSPQTVGYGASHRIAAQARIATVPVGYADGYLRSLGGRAYAAIGDIRVPVVGRVSMDLITLDVSALAPDQSRPGTPVQLIGGVCPIDEFAALGGTMAYEVLNRLGPRFQRRYISP